MIAYRVSLAVGARAGGRRVSAAPFLRQWGCQHQWRLASSVQVQPAGGPGAVASQPGVGAAGELSLSNLGDRAGFLPKPEEYDEKLKPGFRGFKALTVFFLFNAVPFGALLYYLRDQRDSRAQLSLVALPASADEVAAEALRIVRTSAACFLAQHCDGADTNSSGDRGGMGMLRVDPHPPEGTAYVPPTEPLALVPQLERNVLTDIFESPTVDGLQFVHLAVSRQSAPGAAVLAGTRRASLLYMSFTRGAYCTVSGQVSILSDQESRRRYWKGNWAFSFPLEQVAETEKEAPPQWAHPDYILLRIAVDEVSVQATVDGPQRWEQRRVKRVRDLKGGSDVKWKFLSTGSAAASTSAA